MSNNKRYIIKEESGSAKRACVEIIRNSVPRQLAQYLDTPLLELPEEFQNYLSQGAAEVLFNNVANAPEGANKFMDFLRINLYNEFNIRNRFIGKYLKGIARIACRECNFYGFGFAGGIDVKKLYGLKRIMSILSRSDENLVNELGLDSDFNGMSYEQLRDRCSEFLENFKSSQETELSQMQITNVCDYDIIRVPDTISSHQGVAACVAVPTQQGHAFLNALHPFVDWCVCDPTYGTQEYSQYTQGGGAFYICLKHGFKQVRRPQVDMTDENYNPLDEYGLSMIAVVVGTDGSPENITTRWNHNFHGENNDNLWNAVQLQRILNVRYHEVFKPRSREEIEQMENFFIRENKIKKQNNMRPQNNKKIMTESQIIELVKNAAIKSMGLMKENKAPKSNKLQMTESQLVNFLKEATSLTIKKMLNERWDDAEDAEWEEIPQDTPNQEPQSQSTGDVSQQIESNIREFANPTISRYLDTPLSELPSMFDNFRQLPEFNQMANNGDDLMDFVKDYLFDHIGISQAGPLGMLLPGITRILGQEFGMFNFDRSTNATGIMNLIGQLQDAASAGQLRGFDSDLNGMTCQEVINAINHNLQNDDNADFDFDSFVNSANVLNQNNRQM